MNKLIAAGIGFVLAWLISHVIGDFARMAIWKRASNIEPDATFSEAKLHHSFIRMRDDISEVRAMLTFANALLAAILASLLF
jgi:hypothetical protein